MHIFCVHKRFHWASISAARAVVEALRELGHRVSEGPDPTGTDADMVWLIIYAAKFPPPEYKGLVACLHFSDPNHYKSKRAARADLYCSSSLELCEEHGYLYFPRGGDTKHFYPIKIEKDLDCVFLGLGDRHPVVHNRVQVVESIRELNIQVVTHGNYWPEHPDNRGFTTTSGMVQALNRAKLSLDIQNHISAYSGRICQAALCGTPTITFDRPDIRKLFKVDEEVFLYKSRSHLLQRIPELLKDSRRLEQVGEAARQRVLSDHLTIYKVKEVLERLSQHGN